MYVTMKEYFNAKGIDLETLPYAFKSAQGFHEHIVFRGGILARLMRGKHRAKQCVWFPEQAKYVNKVLGRQVFNPAAPNKLIIENNNTNVIIYESFGEIDVLWVVPVVDEIVNKIYDDLDTPYKRSSYVGHSIFMDLVNQGKEYPELTSLKATPDEFKERLTKDFKHIEACLGKEFLRIFTNALGYDFTGYDSNALYFRNELGENVRYSFYKDERFEPIYEDLSFTSKRLIDDFESARL